MLIYAGTVEMLAEDFVHQGEERVAGAQGVWAIAALLAGAALMGVLGCVFCAWFLSGST